MTRIECAPLFIYNPARTDMTIEAFQSDSEPGQKPSKLIGIFEFAEKGPEAEKFLSSLITVLDRAHSTAVKISETTESRFEYIVKQVNEKISLDLSLARLEEKIPLRPRRSKNGFSAFLGLLEGENMSFSGINAARGFLFYPIKNNIHDEGAWKMTDILESPKPPLNLFAQISSGPLRAHNILLFSTSTLSDVLSLEYLKKTVSKYPPYAASERLEHFLGQLSSHLPFAAFIIAAQEETEKPSQPGSPPVSPEPLPQKRAKAFALTAPLIIKAKRSMGVMLRFCARQVLAMMLWLGKTIKSATPIILRALKKGEQALRRVLRIFINTLWRGLKSFGHISFKAVQFIFHISLQILLKILRLIKKSLASLLSVSQQKGSKSEAKAMPYVGNRRPLRRHHFPWPLVLGGSLALIGIIAGFFFIQNSLEARKTRAQTFAELKIAQNNYTAALAAISSQNEESAKANLIAAQEVLQKLSNVKLPSAQQQRDELRQKIKEELEKLNHLARLNTIAPLLVFPPNSITDPVALFISGDRLNVFSAAQRLTASLKSPRESVKTADPGLAGQTIRSLAKQDNKIFLVLNDSTLRELDIAKEALTPVSLPKSNIQSLTDFALYNSKLYILDAKAGQIWKSSPGEKGFGEPKAWLGAANPVLHDAAFMAIDGSIYVASPQGATQKFDQGKPSALTVFHSPAPTNVSKFWTSSASKFLYFLDAPSLRLIALDKKTGKPTIQYTAPQIGNTLDFIVEESAKKIYLLMPEGVFVFEATHLAKSQ